MIQSLLYLTQVLWLFCFRYQRCHNLCNNLKITKILFSSKIKFTLQVSNTVQYRGWFSDSQFSAMFFQFKIWDSFQSKMTLRFKSSQTLQNTFFLSALLSVYEYSFLDNTPFRMFPEFINKLSPIIKENAMILKFLENLAVEDHPAPSY